MELALASQLLRAWRDVCKVAKFHKVCVLAFRERALVRTAKLALLEWKERAAESRTRERVRQELLTRGDAVGMESRGSSRLARRRREKRREEEETSALTAELNKLKMQAAFNFFASRFLRKALLKWRDLARTGLGSEKRRERERERERKMVLTARKFCRLMRFHKPFNAWKLLVQARKRSSRLNADKEYRALMMHQVIIQKKKELRKKKESEKEKENLAPPERTKQNPRRVHPQPKPSVPASAPKPAREEENLAGREGGRKPSKSRKHHSEELEMSLRKLAGRRSESSSQRNNHRSGPLAAQDREAGESGRGGESSTRGGRTPDHRDPKKASDRSGHRIPGHLSLPAHRQRPNAAGAPATQGAEADLRRKLEERARERVQRRTELRKRYEAKLSLESESTQQEKEEARNYERRIKDLQRIEAKERVYKMELEESERISKQELRQHQTSLARIHYQKRLLSQVGFRAFARVHEILKAKEGGADDKYRKHLFAVAMQGWKLWTMPFWRRKVLFHVHFHGALHNYLTRFRLDRAFARWLGFANAKKFKRHRIVRHHFGFFKGLLAKTERARARAAEFHRKRVLGEHLSTWRDYTSIRSELVLLNELEVANKFRQDYQRGLTRRLALDWLRVAKDLKRERSIEDGKRQAWSKINQWLKEIDEEKREKKSLADRVQKTDKSSLLQLLSKRDYSVPFAFET